MHELFKIIIIIIIMNYRRAALEKWKQRLGPDATYMNLITAFEHAGYLSYAKTVRIVANDGKYT